MGDRGNIIIIDDVADALHPRGLVLYTHWAGSEIGGLLKDALQKAPDRWTDSAYLSRVVFQTLIGTDDGTTGYGLSSYIGDNEHDFLVLDIPRQVVVKVKHSGGDIQTAPEIMRQAMKQKGTPFAKFSGVAAS